ncbi:Uncharacterized protein SCF082_LOCUS29500 [Durusdinium trenchii]
MSQGARAQMRQTAPPGLHFQSYRNRPTASPLELESAVPDIWEFHQRRSMQISANAQQSSQQSSQSFAPSRASMTCEMQYMQRLPDPPGLRKTSEAVAVVPENSRPKGTHRGQVLMVSLLLGITLFLLRSSSWQEETMAARPDEVYKVYATMMSMMPQGGKEALKPRRPLSAKPKPIFDLKAGLFTAYVVGICSPGESFNYMVDTTSCQQKLEAFCVSLREATPNDSYLKLGDRLYENCMDTAKTENGLSVSLLYGPVPQLWSHEPHDPSNLEEEFMSPASNSVDWAEFCSTVADCEQLVALRSWSWIMAFAILLGVGTLTACCGAYALHWAKPQADFPKTRFRCGVLSLMLFSLAAGVYFYIAQTFPVSSYIRSESLFYFMLPDPGDARRLEELSPVVPRALADSTKHLAKGWKRLLLSLTGALLRGLAQGDMAHVYLELQESLERGWRLADVLFQRWLKYIRYALNQAPSDGAIILRDTGKRLQELDDWILHLISSNETNSTKQDFDKQVKDLSVELHQQMEEMMVVNERATELVEHSQKLVQTILLAWQDLQQPISSTVDRIKHAFGKKGKKPIQKMMSIAKNLALDQSTVNDLKIIFNRLFQTLPTVVSEVRLVASDFNSLTSSFGPLVKRTRKTMNRGSKLVANLLRFERDNIKLEAQNLLKELQQPNGLQRAAKIWTQLTKQEMKELEAQTGAISARLLRTDSEGPRVASLVQPLVKERGMATPMVRISGIFLQQLQSLGSSGFQPMQEQQLCSWQMPSACTNLGLDFFCFVMLQIAATVFAIKMSRSA